MSQIIHHHHHYNDHGHHHHDDHGHHHHDDHGHHHHDDHDYYESAWLPDITDMTDADRIVYKTYENWVSRTVCPQHFECNLELISTYATYANYANKISVDRKVKKAQTSFWGIKNSLKKEIAIANEARKELREIDEAKRTKMASKFNKNSEDSAVKKVKVDAVMDGMRHTASTKKDINKSIETLKKVQMAKELLLNKVDLFLKKEKNELSTMLEATKQLRIA